MEGLRAPELLIVIALVAILFGPSRLPALGAGIGKAIRNFKDAASGKGDEARPPADAKAGGPPGRGA